MELTRLDTSQYHCPVSRHRRTSSLQKSGNFFTFAPRLANLSYYILNTSCARCVLHELINWHQRTRGNAPWCSWCSFLNSALQTQVKSNRCSRHAHLHADAPANLKSWPFWTPSGTPLLTKSPSERPQGIQGLPIYVSGAWFGAPIPILDKYMKLWLHLKQRPFNVFCNVQQTQNCQNDSLFFSCLNVTRRKFVPAWIQPHYNTHAHKNTHSDREFKHCGSNSWKGRCLRCVFVLVKLGHRSVDDGAGHRKCRLISFHWIHIVNKQKIDEWRTRFGE